MSKKLQHLAMRMSDDWLCALRSDCRRKARTMTAHIERSVEIARVIDDACNGNDDPEFVREILSCVSRR
ncbi:MAG: hypothetical protein HY360_27115 [Verrucomicrobia bacterium]|nr:hypothetical protein [Verrucomicrobiota bacterium]